MKLFSSLYQGTLRGRSDEILVFTNLLAHADQHGIVDKHWKAIAEETGLSKDRVEAAITHLEAPDAESRSPDMDGRRITRLDDHRAWGWQIVNYGKYRAIRNEEDRREQNRVAQAKFRSKQSKPPSSQAEAEAYTEEEIQPHSPSARSVGKCEIPKDWQPKPETIKALAGELTGAAPSQYVPFFVDYCQANAKRYKNFDSAFRNCVRQDWPKLRANGAVKPKVTACADCGGPLSAGYTMTQTGAVCNGCALK